MYSILDFPSASIAQADVISTASAAILTPVIGKAVKLKSDWNEFKSAYETHFESFDTDAAEIADIIQQKVKPFYDECTSTNRLGAEVEVSEVNAMHHTFVCEFQDGERWNLPWEAIDEVISLKNDVEARVDSSATMRGNLPRSSTVGGNGSKVADARVPDEDDQTMTVSSKVLLFN